MAASSADMQVLTAKRERFYKGLAIALVVVFFAIRIQYAMGWWGDEAYQIATSWRYVLGDVPFVQSWDMNFSSSLMYAPFTWMFRQMVGSLDGIVLVYRLYFIAMQSLVGYLAWRTLRTRTSFVVALLSAAVTTCTLTYFACMPGYGCDWQWFTVASLLMFNILDNEKLPTVKQGVLVGICAAISTVSNPTLVFGSVGLVLASWLVARKRRQGQVFTITLLATLACVGAIFVGTLVVMAGDQFLPGLKATLGSEDHSFSLLVWLRALWITRVPVAILTVPGVIGAVYFLTVGKRHLVRALVVGWALEIGAVTAMLVKHIPNPIYETQILLLGFATTTLIIVSVHQIATREKPQTSYVFTLLVMPATLCALGLFIGSNGGVLSAAQLYVPFFVGGLILLGKNAQKNLSLKTATLAALCVVACVGIGASLVYSVDDVPLYQATQRVRSGPYAGILTAPSRVREYEAIRSAVLKATPKTATHIVFFETYCIGYLFNDVRVGSFYTWSTPVDSPRLAPYLKKMGTTLDVIVATRYRTTGSSAAISVSRTGDMAIPQNIDMSVYRLAEKTPYCEVYVRK